MYFERFTKIKVYILKVLLILKSVFLNFSSARSNANIDISILKGLLILKPVF